MVVNGGKGLRWTQYMGDDDRFPAPKRAKVYHKSQLSLAGPNSPRRNAARAHTVQGTNQIAASDHRVRATAYGHMNALCQRAHPANKSPVSHLPLQQAMVLSLITGAVDSALSLGYLLYLLGWDVGLQLGNVVLPGKKTGAVVPQ